MYYMAKCIISRCSKRTFNPIKINTNPPMNSALFLYLEPNLLPIHTPNMDSISVQTPIILTDGITFTLKNANIIPTVKASMLVAIANINSSL